MVDANQAWDLERRSRWADASPSRPRAGSRSRCAPTGPGPSGSVSPRRAPIPLAAGENVIGADAFDALIASRAIAVVQPDLAKWGGVSGRARLSSTASPRRGLRYCPHYLGAGIGLLASAHVLAANGARRRLARGRRQREPAANAALPAAREPARRAHRARRGTRARHRARHRRLARDVRARTHRCLAQARSPRRAIRFSAAAAAACAGRRRSRRGRRRGFPRTTRTPSARPCDGRRGRCPG